MLEKIFWTNLQRIIEVLRKINFHLAIKNIEFGLRDPRSGKNLFLISDPGVKKATDPGSGSATLYRQQLFQIHCG
jgi:hypothetical protein